MGERGRTQKSGVGRVDDRVDLNKRDISSAVRKKRATRSATVAHTVCPMPRREGSAIGGCRSSMIQPTFRPRGPGAREPRNRGIIVTH